jgi:RHS repeat-associated protein
MGPQEAQTSVVSDVTYGPAGEMLTMTGMVNESRGYNSRLQLTSFNGVSYGYGASNNGRIASETVSGETVVYQYDELNRLIRAETQGDVWGQEFIYDGFGNLTEKRVTKGSAPAMSVPVDGATNRAIGYAYDANGNQLWTNTQTLSYDYDNRIVWVDNRNNTGRMYGYDADNRRVYEADWTLVDGTAVFGQQAVHFWGVTGQRMGSYWLAMDGGQPPYYGPSVTLTVKSDRVYFGARLLKGETGWSGEDRLGSVGQFYPYGEARVGDPKRFATYEREGGGLDYAVNRYYWVGTGRFMSPDPYMANIGGAGDMGDPGSWNRYGYVGGDPVNWNDPGGLTKCYGTPPNMVCFDSVTVSARTLPGFPGGGGGGVGGSTVGSLQDLPDPMLTTDVVREFAMMARYALDNGQVNDCEALAGFAFNVARTALDGNDDIANVIKAFEVFVPAGGFPGVLGSAIYGVTNSIQLRPNQQTSGYLRLLQPNGGGDDQAHHFAFYLQIGAVFANTPGKDLAAAAAELADAMWRMQTFDMGDYNLAVAAMDIGRRLRTGELKLNQFGTEVLQLCQRGPQRAP